MHIVTSCPCVALFLAILFCTVSYASPTSETSLPAAETVAANVPVVFADPWPAHPGIAPYFGHQTLWLQKRQCLENGSNFCFDDSNRMCPDCGGCCELDGGSWCCPGEGDTCCPGEACCKADETCCGDGCCPKGRRCSGGKCEAPGVSSVTATSTKTVHATRTHSEVEVITVQVVVRVTSTLNSIVTTTITSESGTQTDVTYETTTLLEKRELSARAPARSFRRLEPNVGDEQGIVARAFSNSWKKLVLGGHLQRPEYDDLLASPTEPRRFLTSLAPETPEIWRRQNDDDGISTVIVTVTTTKFDETTVEDSRTTTDLVTSTVTKTIYQTKTSVVGARDTVSVTSTVTITSRRPTTDTVTSTSTDFLDPTNGAAGPATTPSLVDEDSSSSSSSSGLSTPAMIGLGVGVGCAAIFLAAVALIFLRRSRKKKNKPFVPDYIIAPPPAPIPPQRRDAYFASKEKSPGHSRGVSTTTQDSSGASSDNRGAGPERMPRRSIPHPSTSTVGKKTRFAELEGQGPGGMG